MPVCSLNLVAATWSEFNDWLLTGILHFPYEEILQCRRIGADLIFKESEDVFSSFQSPRPKRTPIQDAPG